MRTIHVLLLVTASLLFAAGAFPQHAMVLEGAVVFDGVATRPQKNSVVVIEAGRITGFGPRKQVIVPEGAKRLNLRGKYIIPGLIEAHAQAPSPSDLLQMLAWGVTSVNCMFPSTVAAAEMERWTLQDTSRAPQIYAAAPIFSAAGGTSAGKESPADTSVNRFPATPEEARAEVRKVRASGIRRIVLSYDAMDWCGDSLPRMGKDVMEAIIDEAAKQKLFTSVHAPKLADASEAIEAGAMSLSRGILDGFLDASTIGTLLTRNDYYVTGLSSYEFIADPQAFMKAALADKRFRASLTPAAVKELTSAGYADRVRTRYPKGSAVRSQLSVLRNNLMTILGNYVLLVMGSALPALPGIGAHLEMEYMVKAGMTPYQALTAATTFGGQYLGAATKVGTIETGRQADLVILDADPLADIRNTRSINTVIKHGRVFDPKQLLKAARK